MAKFNVLYCRNDGIVADKIVDADRYIASGATGWMSDNSQPDGVLRFYNAENEEIASFASGLWVWVERLPE